MMSGYTSLRLGPFSALVHTRSLCAGAVLLCVLVSTAVLAIGTGAYPVGIFDIGAVLRGEADRIAELIVLDYRLPRLVAGLCSGAALGAAGAIFQSLLRNPLASPDVIGFTAGASCGAVAIVAVTGSSVFLVPGALGGGLIAAALAFALSWRGGLSPYRLVLIGIGLGFTLSAITNFLLTRTDILRAADALKWLAGSIDAASGDQVVLLVAGLALLLPFALWQQFSLSRLQIDEDVAAGLGIRVQRARVLIALAGVALTGLAVSVAGPLPFVAFVSAPIARRLAGTASAAVFTAAMVGAIITVLADLAATTLVAGTRLPTGVFTALVGAPYFVGLLIAQSRKGVM